MGDLPNIYQSGNTSEDYSHICFCVGPQNGEPLCPCRMRGVTIKNGRYVIPEKDIGPVKQALEQDD